eukprot:1208558-Amphidinium_carterae.1
MSDTCPTLLRNSRLYDLIAQRPILVEDTYLAMGFPVPGCNEVIDEWANLHWPFSWLSGREGVVEKASAMIGNGIHLQSAACVLAFALGTATLTEKQAADLLAKHIEELRLDPGEANNDSNNDAGSSDR